MSLHDAGKIMALGETASLKMCVCYLLDCLW